MKYSYTTLSGFTYYFNKFIPLWADMALAWPMNPKYPNQSLIFNPKNLNNERST